MDTTVKVVSIHLVAAIVAALISVSFSLGWLGFKNEALAFVAGLIILYVIGQVCQNQFGEEIKGFSAWLWDGIHPFAFCWSILLTILFNYL